jgi:LSD1 subclass zinc finger protein
MRHEFKQYPAGMRYLMLRSGAENVKMARCSVMALCEGNNALKEEAVQI